MSIEDDIATLRGAITADLGTKVARVENYGYPDSLALCAIDSVYSLGVRYGATKNVVKRYREHRAESGGNPQHDNLTDLMAAIDAAGGPESAASTLFDNNNLTPGAHTLKSVALASAARRVIEQTGCNTTEDLRKASVDPEALRAIGTAWRSEPGLGPASWSYFGMLAGVDGVKVDRMIQRYVTKALGMTRPDDARIAAAVTGVASSLGVAAHDLDHAIWRKQSARKQLAA